MKTNSKDTLCDAIRAIKAQLVKTPEDEARFRAEANFFVRQALENTGFVRTKLSHCVDQIGRASCRERVSSPV